MGTGGPVGAKAPPRFEAADRPGSSGGPVGDEGWEGAAEAVSVDAGRLGRARLDLVRGASGQA